MNKDGTRGVSTPSVELWLLVLLGLVFMLGCLVKRTKLESVLNVPTLALCAGTVFSACVVYSGASDTYSSILQFKNEIFLNALLPSIIIDASLGVDIHLFLMNFGTICNCAFLGTTISCFTVGTLQWAFGAAGAAHSMSFLLNLVFGALISATDPVSVLACFQALEADGNLFAIVFGESVLNDAVAMVLFDTVSGFIDYQDHPATPVNGREVLWAIGSFFGILLVSVCLGLAFGFILAAIMKAGYFQAQGSVCETGLVVVFMYSSYFFAVVTSNSGIVSLLFCGMVVQAYVKPNMSAEAAQLIHFTFELLAGLFDIFLFLYIGVTLCTFKTYNVWRYATLCLFSMGVGRAIGVLPCCGMANLMRPLSRKMNWKIQFMLWWSALRGAMAFSLGNLAVERFGEDGEVMRTCVFYLTFITVVFNGGSSKWLLSKLKLREVDRLAMAGGVQHANWDSNAGYARLDTGSLIPLDAKGVSMAVMAGCTNHGNAHTQHAHESGAYLVGRSLQHHCATWSESGNMLFYSAMMAIHCKYLSKWLLPADSNVSSLNRGSSIRPSSDVGRRDTEAEMTPILSRT